MERFWKVTLCTLLSYIVSVCGREEYASRIPNGDSVPHPCDASQMWRGVGHLAQQGEGERNPFGLAFAAAGLVWTRELCETDSDGDGRTNGEELGDPHCVWQPGGAAPHTDQGITHPGFCNPADSEWCRHKQHRLSCDSGAAGGGGDTQQGFDCPALDEEGVMYADLTIEPTGVPEDQHFTKVCQSFQVAADRPYHAIAFEPIIDNAQVVQRIFFYGCDEEVGETGSCDAVEGSCLTMVSMWTKGSPGYCMHDDVGVLFGQNNYRYVAIIINWENAHLQGDLTDASGMRVFYTADLRQYNQNIAVLAQTDITIPPMTASTTMAGLCPKECTGTMQEAVHMTRAVIVMHKLGVSGRLEVHRDGELLQVLIDYTDYQYDNVTIMEFNPPATVMPNDEIKAVCTYNSRDGGRLRLEPTYAGEEFTSEICYSLMFFYPGRPDFFCMQHGDYHSCADPCDYEWTGYRFGVVFTYVAVFQMCTGDGVCDDACYNVVSPLYHDSCFPAVEGSIRTNPQLFIEDPNLYHVFAVVDKCRARHLSPTPVPTTTTEECV